MHHAAHALALALALAACAGEAPQPTPVSMPIFVTGASRAPIDAFVSYLPPSLSAGVREADAPEAAMAASTEGDRPVALVVDEGRCEGCFRIERSGRGYVIRGDAPLGIQYGLSALLEAMGVRFLHPQRTFVPATLAAPDPARLDVDEAPEVAVRGLHLHILHPIEPYFDFWEPSEEHLDDAARTLDWLVKNRANYVTWTALDDVQGAPNARRDAVLAHQREIVARAHVRGLRVGLGVQIFGLSNLQRAFDLVDSGDDPAVSIPARLSVLSSIPYDAFQLSFGEFFAADPAAFVRAVELAYDGVHATWPGAEVTATVHVGNFEDTRVSYMGREQLYYFLVQYADRPIRPWVHTVMYYGLFGDAGGAYNHDSFTEHREFLLDRLQAGEPVGYHPETAYWVAFDVNVPTYLPLYVRTRFEDLDGIRSAAATAGHGGLEDHVVFSSGWEWGYWQNDWSVLRMGWRTPARFGDLVHDMFDPLPDGPAAADAVVALADLQRDALIDHRLAAYLAGQDGTFELGVSRGFWAQPRRPAMSDLAAMSVTERATFEVEVVARLARLAEDSSVLLARVEALPAVESEPFLAELRDGLAIDVERARFAHALWSAAVQSADAEDATAALAELDAALAAGQAIVDRRHAALHDPDPDEILAERSRNALLYRYGYLREAGDLCFWVRERVQFRNAFLGESATVPPCVL